MVARRRMHAGAEGGAMWERGAGTATEGGSDGGDYATAPKAVARIPVWSGGATEARGAVTLRCSVRCGAPARLPQKRQKRGVTLASTGAAPRVPPSCAHVDGSNLANVPLAGNKSASSSRCGCGTSGESRQFHHGRNCNLLDFAAVLSSFRALSGLRLHARGAFAVLGAAIRAVPPCHGAWRSRVQAYPQLLSRHQGVSPTSAATARSHLARHRRVAAQGCLVDCQAVLHSPYKGNASPIAQACYARCLCLMPASGLSWMVSMGRWHSNFACQSCVYSGLCRHCVEVFPRAYTHRRVLPATYVWQ
ncbi:protein-s-isoprenylcysteine o-methyltransferase [Gracilaria domingensis]|nr:protein-s-isoprenylcysteine o-methyltransferase [Gracilaria domingensis]